MAEKTFTCIVCPMSCSITVKETPEGLSVTGHTCKRGEAFARDEFTAPKRMFTSTVVVEGGVVRRLPVITSAEIPKEKMAECLKEVYQVRVKAPVKCGDVVVPDLLGLGVNLLASRDVDAV
ncbi:MAG: DUF1667 domain-containing protein [Lachnospiraceae bacterium]|nr:DUF1667 domain-containing protein [Lachnospiraceae bacterium]MBR0153540.1 DUF1667 domain-containing protein [Lachnospiraceae bacterium]